MLLVFLNILYAFFFRIKIYFENECVVLSDLYESKKCVKDNIAFDYSFTEGTHQVNHT